MSDFSIGNVSYSRSLVYNYLGVYPSSSKKLQDMFTEFNVTPTGSSLDLSELNNAVYSQYSEQVKEQIDNQNSKTEVPWASLCAQIGVSVTGDYETDYNAFNQAIQLFSSSAIDGQAQTYLAGLKTEAQQVFGSYNPDGNQQPSVSFTTYKANYLV